MYVLRSKQIKRKSEVSNTNMDTQRRLAQFRLTNFRGERWGWGEMRESKPVETCRSLSKPVETCRAWQKIQTPNFLEKLCYEHTFYQLRPS